MKPGRLPDEGVLPRSGGRVTDRAGVNERYLAKHGTPYGVGAKLNSLPPGSDIEDQPCSRAAESARRLSHINVPESDGSGFLDYPGSGWRERDE
jgi:hypothetical protein